MVYLLAIGKQTMTKRLFEVRAEWDELARLWIATSADVPGLWCETADVEKLVATVRGSGPELLVANAVLSHGDASEVPVKVGGTTGDRAARGLMARLYPRLGLRAETPGQR
jgi:Domain of unknown function (DUF1902)